MTCLKGNTQIIQERELFDDVVRCILYACPVALKEEPDFIESDTILRAQRYVFDSRMTDAAERMKLLEKPHGIWSYKTYYRWTRECPKQIKVTEAILKTKKKILQQLHP